MSGNPLPMQWIDKLFLHMSAMYGSRFADMWRDTNLDAVKALWAEKLGGFIDQPEAIKSALDALDSKPWPPTLPEFLVLCREAAKRTPPKNLALEHKLSDEEMQRNRERIEAIRNGLVGKWRVAP